MERAGHEEIDAVLICSPQNRRYLSGFTGSSAYLLLSAQTCWLITDFRYTEQAARETDGYTIVRQQRHPFAHVAELARSAGLGRVGFEVDKVTVREHERLMEHGPEIAWRGISGWVEELRRKKSPDELEVMAKAARIADDAISEVLADLHPGKREIEVALELEFAMRRLGAEALAFDTIVASGPNGSLPHARPGDRPLAWGDLVTIDFGARYQGYHSDETITVALGKEGPNRDLLRTIYDIVLAAQKAGIAKVGPGVAASDIDATSRTIIEEAGFGPQFGHSTGHGVGLEVHEAPWASRRPVVDYILEPGMVVTVEPGIYLPGIGGVRLEDSLVVTASGSERLTAMPKAWTVIEG